VYKDAKPKQTGPEILNAIFLIFVSKFKVKVEIITLGTKQKQKINTAPFSSIVVHL
jgi:hypothetical protein